MTNSKTTLDRLLRTARRNDPDGTRYGEDTDSLEIPEGIETLTDDYSPGEVQIVAIERNRKGEIVRLLLWDGVCHTKCSSPWSIDDDITEAKLRHLGVKIVSL